MCCCVSGVAFSTLCYESQTIYSSCRQDRIVRCFFVFFLGFFLPCYFKLTFTTNCSAPVFNYTFTCNLRDFKDHVLRIHTWPENGCHASPMELYLFKSMSVSLFPCCAATSLYVALMCQCVCKCAMQNFHFHIWF